MVDDRTSEADSRRALLHSAPLRREPVSAEHISVGEGSDGRPHASKVDSERRRSEVDAEVKGSAAGEWTSPGATGPVALTTQPPRAGFPLTLEVGPGPLPEPAWIEISQIRAPSVQRVGRKLGAVSPEELAQAFEGLNEILGA